MNRAASAKEGPVVKIHGETGHPLLLTQFFAPPGTSKPTSGSQPNLSLGFSDNGVVCKLTTSGGGGGVKGSLPSMGAGGEMWTVEQWQTDPKGVAKSDLIDKGKKKKWDVLTDELVNVEALPDGFKQSNSYDGTLQALSSWVHEEKWEHGKNGEYSNMDVSVATLRWPQFFSKAAVHLLPSSTVNIVIISTLNGEKGKLTIRGDLEWTVDELMRKVVKKRKMGVQVAEGDYKQMTFVLKSVGWNEYLVSRNCQLKDFECMTNAVRSVSSCTLSLRNLTPEDEDSLKPIIQCEGWELFRNIQLVPDVLVNPERDVSLVEGTETVTALESIRKDEVPWKTVIKTQAAKTPSRNSASVSWSHGALDPAEEQQLGDVATPAALRAIQGHAKQASSKAVQSWRRQKTFQHSGYLYKLGQRGGWAKRFFVLAEDNKQGDVVCNTLSYYIDANMQEMRGSATLQGRTIRRLVPERRRWLFELCAPENPAGTEDDAETTRAFKLYAETECDMNDWVNAAVAAGAKVEALPQAHQSKGITRERPALTRERLNSEVEDLDDFDLEEATVLEDDDGPLPGEVVYEGWLEKKGDGGLLGRRNWSKRWCRLYSDGRLAYYKGSEASPTKELKGIVHLQGRKVRLATGAVGRKKIKEEKHAFEILAVGQSLNLPSAHNKRVQQPTPGGCAGGNNRESMLLQDDSGATPPRMSLKLPQALRDSNRTSTFSNNSDDISSMASIGAGSSSSSSGGKAGLEGRTYFFLAASEEEMDTWLNHVAHVIETQELESSAALDDNGSLASGDVQDSDLNMNGHVPSFTIAETIRGFESAVNTIKAPLTCRMFAVEDCGEEMLATGQYNQVFLQVTLVFGEEPLQPNAPHMANAVTQHLARDVLRMESRPVAFSANPFFGSEWITSPFYDLSEVPFGTRLSVMMVALDSKNKETPVAGVSVPLFNEDGVMRSGLQQLSMWPHPELQAARDPELLSHKCERNVRPLDLFRGVAMENPLTDGGTLNIFLEELTHTVTRKIPSLPVTATRATSQSGSCMVEQPQGPEEKREMVKISTQDPRKPLSDAQMSLLRRTTGYCLSPSETPAGGTASPPAEEQQQLGESLPLLPYYLRAVRWGLQDDAADARRSLALCPKVPPTLALQLLDIRYGDPAVREYAVRCVSAFPDQELEDYLLQLVQALKLELYHDSALARFLIFRAVTNPLILGHALFWLLRSEVHNPEACERYGLLLRVYCENCVCHRDTLRRMNKAHRLLLEAADFEVPSDDDERKMIVKKQLDTLNTKLHFGEFQLPLTPKMLCHSIKVEKCKIMDSKKKPLWLVFNNADPEGEGIVVMFKTGDDLRQDKLTLQLINVMDSMWLNSGLDLHMKGYRVCATGDEMGMLEMVTNSRTLSWIQTKYGGTIAGSWKKAPVLSYLSDNCNQDSELEASIDNFVRSCAGYCVATYVLGIGDRHSDNIMVHNDGHLFHIDFGHFLGNFKSKKIAGVKINRERSPFVFTPAMAFVMGGKKSQRFNDFQDMACRAYNNLRRNNDFLMNLFTLMIPAGMPELTQTSDLNYLLDQLVLKQSNDEANEHFLREIKNAMADSSKQADDMFHNIVHA